MRVVLVIAAIVLLLGVIAIFAWRRRRSASPVTTTSHTATADSSTAVTASSSNHAARAATDALARIAGEVGRERGLQLAQIARRFLTEAYGVPAMTSSSAELAELLRRREVPVARWEALLDALDAVRIGGPTAIDDLEAHLRAALT